ncbi:MAG TPA: hypothetical protein VF506_20575, partial [Streptosporangiaceae bacterium]
MLRTLTGMTRMRAVVVTALLAAAVALAGAACDGLVPAQSSQRPAGTPSATSHGEPRHSRMFTAKVSRIRHRSQLLYSWHPGCPVPPSRLRLITMTYRGFDHQVHMGRLVVNVAV